MSKLGIRIATKVKQQLGIELHPVITRSYTKTFDAGEARFYMDEIFDGTRASRTFRFEERTTDIAGAKKLTVYTDPRDRSNSIYSVRDTNHG